MELEWKLNELSLFSLSSVLYGEFVANRCMTAKHAGLSGRQQPQG